MDTDTLTVGAWERDVYHALQAFDTGLLPDAEHEASLTSNCMQHGFLRVENWNKESREATYFFLNKLKQT